MKRQGYLKGALIISAGGFVSKLLGAVYRIPLIAILGGTGMGIYQMVYPLYCILLTVSASGIPTGIARLIASGNAEGAEKRAFLLYGGIGLCGSLVMYALSGILSAAQGEPAVALCCKLLSPSVLFVAIISVVRGYFQGKGNMYPTAFTEIAEQAIKVAFGILLAYIYRGDITRSVGAAVFAVTISEAASAAFAVILYLGGRRRTKPLYRAAPSASLKSVLSYTLPLTVSAIAQPLSQLIESIVVVRILRTMTADATAVYGIFSGCAITLVNIPVSVTYGLAAASVPKISPLAQSGRISEAKEMCKKALLYTLIISLPCAAALFERLHVPIGPDGEPRGVLRLPVGDVEGYLIESRSQAICLLPDEAPLLPAMLGQAAGPLCEKFGLTRRAQPSPPAPRFEDALREEYGDVY